MRIGIAGNGMIVRRMLQDIKEIPEIETAAICVREKSLEKGRILAEEFGIPAVDTDYRTFLEREDMDTVYIGIVNQMHYEYAKKALEAGKHVICEKPFTVTAGEAKEEEEKGNYVEEIPGKGFRRVIASPQPVSIVEIDVIKAVMDADQIVIACGGGGIPVMEQGYNLKGASAVIEKDRAAGLLAKEIDADVLMILTSVDNVTIDYGTPQERPISHMSIEEAESYINEGQFEFASMLPKIEASVDFVTHGKGRCAIITSLSKAKASLAGKAGTTIE